MSRTTASSAATGAAANSQLHPAAAAEPTTAAEPAVATSPAAGAAPPTIPAATAAGGAAPATAPAALNAPGALDALSQVTHDVRRRPRLFLPNAWRLPSYLWGEQGAVVSTCMPLGRLGTHLMREAI